MTIINNSLILTDRLYNKMQQIYINLQQFFFLLFIIRKKVNLCYNDNK